MTTLSDKQVTDASAALNDFLERVFGFRPAFALVLNDGQYTHVASNLNSEAQIIELIKSAMPASATTKH